MVINNDVIHNIIKRQDNTEISYQVPLKVQTQ